MAKKAPEDKVVNSSISIIGGNKKARQQFSNAISVNYFRGWVHIAASMNARTACNYEPKLFVPKKGGTKLVKTKKVSLKSMKYLCGDGDTRPANIVCRKSNAYSGEYEQVVGDSPVIDALYAGNKFQTGYEVRFLKYLFLELTGNAYLYPLKDSYAPTGFFILPSQWVDIVPGKRGGGELVVGYQYGPQGNSKINFAPEEILHMKVPNPRSLYYGLGKVEAGFSAIEQNEAAHAMDLSFLQNMARPDFAVIFKDGTKTDVDRFTAEVYQELQGTRKNGKFLTTTGDVQIVPLSFPPKSLVGRTETLEEIAGVFGVPITALKATWVPMANAEAGDNRYLSQTISPILRLDEEFLNCKFLPLFKDIDEGAFISYGDVVSEDEEAAVRVRNMNADGVKSVVLSVSKGEIPRDAGLSQLTILYGLEQGLAEEVMGSAGLSAGSDSAGIAPEPEKAPESQTQVGE